MDTETLIKTIIDAAYRVRSSFMPGYLESIYENALIVELEDLGLKVQSQKPLSVILMPLGLSFVRQDMP